MNYCGKVNGEVKILFSHGTHHSKGVCILFDPATKLNEEYNFSNKTGRIILITVYLNGTKISLCNIYAPNNQSEQLEFIQELNNCIIDKSEMTNITIGGDWNCTRTKKDKKGGALWKPTPFRNLLLTTMETFDLIDIYRTGHPNSQHFSYESKSLQVRLRIDFFLVAKFLVKFVSNVGITTSIAPDHKTLLLCLALPETTPRGPGFWKFNNTLLDDENYTNSPPRPPNTWEIFSYAGQAAILGINENGNKREIYSLCKTIVKRSLPEGERNFQATWLPRHHNL